MALVFQADHVTQVFPHRVEPLLGGLLQKDTHDQFSLGRPGGPELSFTSAELQVSASRKLFLNPNFHFGRWPILISGSFSPPRCDDCLFWDFYHVLEEISELLPLLPHLLCRPLVFAVLAGVAALHELPDEFPHHVIVQMARQLLLPGNTHTHTLSVAAENQEDRR